MQTPQDPHKIALWRFEQIEEALDPALSKTQRARILKLKSKALVCRPSGEIQPVPLSTLYRWHRLYRQGGLEALRPKPRRDRGQRRSRLPKAVVDEALRLLTEDPGMSLTLLIAVLKARFAGYAIPRSTLHRRLSERPAYLRLRRAQKHNKRRLRFVARAAHDIWQCDAKGPVQVALRGGHKLLFHILSILDDATRAVLAALIVLSPDLGACVRVFRQAVLRYGLPKKYYADRASIFDSVAFRSGLATLGPHRIQTRAGAKEAHGKIEAYHRVLVLWFTDRLAHQQVLDIVHLQQLLDGVIGLYQSHYHRSIKNSPKAALGQTVSPRQVPPTRLYEVFRREKRLKAHRKTGEVEIGGITYLVPDELRGQRLTFLLDPPGEVDPVVVHPKSELHLPLRRAIIKPQDLPPEQPPPDRHAPGPLQAIYDSWAGVRRPQAEPGFGLPDIYAWLGKIAGRHVPGSDAEAALVQRFYQRKGPWTKVATEHGMGIVAVRLGSGRPIRTYLDALDDLVVTGDEPEPKKE
jgi:transposase InsO family protein